ncbi:MAG TPA: xanthine dehydrogenase family protein molybdopterin-binding subunit [Bacillota bacterium]|nr:xanthine dehydrogenase family protein molybdopterin-binding subunit [Bacillota bacterium]
MEKQYAGESMQRERIVNKVSGTQRYLCDRKVAGMLYAKVLRSECAAADILRIDVSEALNSEGVVAVFTADDIDGPIPRFGSIVSDQPILAQGNVKYQGEPIAVVAAGSNKEAAEAARKIRVEYREKEAVTTVDAALAADAPVVNSDYLPEKREGLHHNVFDEYDFRWGDVDAARKNADFIIKNTYSFPMIYHFSIENYGCLAVPEDGGLTIYTPIQHPFILRRVISGSLGIPQSKIRVAAEEIGGGFGGKGYPKLEPIAAYLALRLKRPIKMVMSFEEGFYAARRLANTTTIETGFGKEGNILFQNIETNYLIGAYAAEGPRIAQKAGYTACGAYKTQNAEIKVRVVNSNTSPSTAFRGFGMPQLNWALERQLDEASRRMGIDRLDLRRKNIPDKGEVFRPNDTPADGDWKSAFEKAVEMIGFRGESSPGEGYGLAIGIKNPIPGSSSNAIVRLHADGSATASVGTTDMGQGSRTVLKQIVADSLGIPFDLVKMQMGDTSTAPFDQATAGSRSTVSMGSAVVEACKDINEQIKEYVSEFYNVDRDKIELKKGHILFEGNDVSYQNFFINYFGPYQADVIGRGCFRGKKSKEADLGGTADFWELVVTAVKLTVDKETGVINVKKIINVTDAGKAINPLQAENQEIGGAVMALGHTLMEKMVYDLRGRLLNADPLNYCIPTSKDVPEDIEGYFIENEDGPGPFGSKGIAESSVIALAAAIGNAVEDATGISFRDLPITKEKLFFKLRESNRK